MTDPDQTWPQIGLHIGAHKTATTHLQRSIRQAARDLAGQGVYFHGPQQLRGPGKGIADRFGLTEAARGADVAAALRILAPQARRLVLSDENYIGILQNRHGRLPQPLYPRAVERVQQLAARIAPQGMDVFVSIRNPAHFLTSAYGQALIAGKHVPLAQFKSRNGFDAVDWVGLVGRVRSATGVRSLTIWRYEDYTPLFGRICAGLLGAQAGALVQPLAERVHRGLSVAAAAELARPDRGDPAEVRARCDIGPDNPPFDAFDAQDQRLAQDLYADQAARIAAMPDVNWLAP